ncbi:unnamed protein product, partial [Rotaria sp. Silwood2]
LEILYRIVYNSWGFN